MLRNRGEINVAIFMGVVLLIVALAVQIIAGLLRKRELRQDENF